MKYSRYMDKSMLLMLILIAAGITIGVSFLTINAAMAANKVNSGTTTAGLGTSQFGQPISGHRN